MKNLTISLVILEKGLSVLIVFFLSLATGDSTRTKDENVLYHFIAADDTGRVSLSLWDENVSSVRPGEIFRVTGGCAFLSSFCISLICLKILQYLQKSACTLCGRPRQRIISAHWRVWSRIVEPFSSFCSFTMAFTEVPDMSAVQWQADPQNPRSMASPSPAIIFVFLPSCRYLSTAPIS